MELAYLPKVELHLHLDCSLSYEVVSQLSPAISLAQYQQQFIAPTKCNDLVECISRAESAVALMQTPEQLRLVTFDLVEQLLNDKVIYAEIRFAPLLHTRNGLSAEQVVAAVERAVSEACQDNDIELRLILCSLRHFSQEQSLTTVKLVERFKGTRVAGFDLAGDEAGCAIEPHIEAFKYATSQGIPCTAHAGEARGAESVWDTLDYFQVKRLGHGVRSVEDPALLEYLKQHQIHLEICPTSNVQTNVVASYTDHPLPTLHQQGVSLGVNTDGRTISNLSLADEYLKIQQYFGWGKPDFLRCNLNALKAAFIPQELKQSLIRRLEEAYLT